MIKEIASDLFYVFVSFICIIGIAACIGAIGCKLIEMGDECRK